MPVALLALIEQLVMSPAVQEEAWDIIAPHLRNGTMPDDETMDRAYLAAEEAHAGVVREA